MHVVQILISCLHFIAMVGVTSAVFKLLFTCMLLHVPLPLVCVYVCLLFMNGSEKCEIAEISLTQQ